MCMLELGPDDGRYEWKHIMSNPFTRKFLRSSKEQLGEFTAHERFV